MDNKKIADLLEELIDELKRNDDLFFIDIDNDRITYIEGVIKELREGEDEEVRFTLPDCFVTDGTTGEQ